MVLGEDRDRRGGLRTGLAHFLIISAKEQVQHTTRVVSLISVPASFLLQQETATNVRIQIHLFCTVSEVPQHRQLRGN